jgi:hypothetical protein
MVTTQSAVAVSLTCLNSTATTQKASELKVNVGVRKSKHALGAMCNVAHVAEAQTEVDAVREAGKRWRGKFPSEQLLKKCHETHPSFSITWRRVIRETGIGPGLEQSKLKEMRHYCDACPTCQKLQPARERVQARQGTIRKRPFAEFAFARHEIHLIDHPSCKCSDWSAQKLVTATT